MSSAEDDAKVPAPPAELILSTPEHLVAFGFGAGLSPRAPGTMGTLVAVPLVLAMQYLPLPAYLAVCAALFVFGCWVCGESARLLGVHDHGGIVFDEIAGFAVTCVPLAHAAGLVHGRAWLWLLVAFGLFRLFDILKPWPISWLDRRVHGGIGIMLDDLLAGVLAAAWLLMMLKFWG